MTGRSCSAQSPLARPAQGGAGAFRSFLEREFNAPKTPPSHGFRGFVAIKEGAKRAYRGLIGVRPFSEAARSVKARTAGKLQPNSSRLNCKTTQPQSSDSNSYGALRFWISRLPLFFQEQIKGSKNAPIARFDGLCCYQTRSKKACRASHGVRPFRSRAAKPKPARLLKAPAGACHPSGEPYGSRCQMEGAQEVASRLVVTRGGGPVLLALGKEVLNLMASQAMPARQR